MASLTAAHFAVGVWVATSVPGPLLAADDLAYLSMGRTLAGKGAAPLAAQPPYGFLYSLLLSPGWLIGLNEPSMLRWARVINALLGALLLPALYLLVRRVLDTDRATAILAAVAGSILPAGFLTASIAWTENLIPLLLVAALLGLAHFRDQPSRLSAAMTFVAAILLYATHPRLVLVSAVLIVSLAALAGSARSPVRNWLVIVLGWGSILVVEMFRRSIQTAAFDDSGTYFVGDLVSRRGISDVPEMAVHAAGSSAYLILASAGIAALGVVTLWRSGPIGRTTDIVLVSTVLVAGWFLTGVERSDAYLHGRYVEVVAPVVVAAGIVGARRLSLKSVAKWLIPGVVAAGVVGAWAGPGNNWLRPRSPMMMFGVEIGGAPFGSPVFEPGAAASVAIVVGVLVLVSLTRAGPVLAGVVMAAFVALGVLSGLDGLTSLYEGSGAQRAEVALDGVEVGRLWVDIENVPASVSGAVAWNVGLDSVTTTLDGGATHWLLSSDALVPDGTTLIVEMGGATLWKAP